MSIATDLQRQARVIPVQPDNRVSSIAKRADGSLSVTQRSGATFVISKGDELFQSYLVYMILDGEA
ncbi:hypothetical protein [Panacagrimonas sp.]|uniref:hypothetical protein n=1 Tax=Panacagrimonas sp. TaxID=2480088 RepID=UPI003B51F459